MVNKAKLIEKIAELVRDKRVEGISDLRDESSREGMRVVIELEKGCQSEYHFESFVQTYTASGYIWCDSCLHLVNNEPMILNLKADS